IRRLTGSKKADHWDTLSLEGDRLARIRGHLVHAGASLEGDEIRVSSPREKQRLRNAETALSKKYQARFAGVVDAVALKEAFGDFRQRLAELQTSHMDIRYGRDDLRTFMIDLEIFRHRMNEVHTAAWKEAQTREYELRDRNMRRAAKSAS
ncbi:MAG: hypothetical protein ACRED4_06230, partial [Brevundimonas sp.]